MNQRYASRRGLLKSVLKECDRGSLDDQFSAIVLSHAPYMWRHIGKPGLLGSIQCFHDQHFSYIHIHRLFWNCAESENVFSADAHMWQKVQTLIKHRTERAVSNQSQFFSFLYNPGFPSCQSILTIKEDFVVYSVTRDYYTTRIYPFTYRVYARDKVCLSTFFTFSKAPFISC